MGVHQIAGIPEYLADLPGIFFLVCKTACKVGYFFFHGSINLIKTVFGKLPHQLSRCLCIAVGGQVEETFQVA